jgi:hypothetical protein
VQVEKATAAAAEAASQAAASAAALGWQQEELARLGAERTRQQQRSAGIRNLRRLMRQADDARAALDARATEVTLTLEADALARVQIGGRPAERSKQTVQAVDPVEIAIEGVGRIEVRPRVAQAVRWRRDLADAEHGIAGLLQELDLAPPDEPAVRAGQLSLFVPRADRPPDPAALEGLLAETERQAQALSGQVEAARAECDQRDESNRRHAFAAVQAKERVDEAQVRVLGLARSLAQAEELDSQAELDEAVARARRTLEEIIAEVGRLSEGDPARALAEIEARIGQLEQAIEGRRARLSELRGSIEGLQARVRLHARASPSGSNSPVAASPRPGASMASAGARPWCSSCCRPPSARPSARSRSAISGRWRSASAPICRRCSRTPTSRSTAPCGSSTCGVAARRSRSSS